MLSDLHPESRWSECPPAESRCLRVRPSYSNRETHSSSVTQKRWSFTSSGTVQEAGSHVPWGHSGTWTPPSVASAPKGPCHCLCSQPWKREDRSGGRGRGAVCHVKETHRSCSRLPGRTARGPCPLAGTAGRRRPTGHGVPSAHLVLLQVHECCRLNIAPQHSQAEALNLQCDCLRDVRKRKQTSPHLCSGKAVCGPSERWSSACSPEGDISPPGTLNLDLQNREENVLFKLPSLWHFVLAAQLRQGEVSVDSSED